MKKTYSIQYDLRQPGQNYEKLIAAIKRLFPMWAKPLESCFAIVTTMNSAQIRDALTPYVDANDPLLVMQIGPDWASRNLAADVAAWFNQNVG